jgi:hypothetical protein
VQRPDLPPWLYPPQHSERLDFDSGTLTFAAGVELFIGRIRAAPGRYMRLAQISISNGNISPDNRLRLAGPSCGDWFNVPWQQPFNGLRIGIPIFLVVRDAEIELFFTRVANGNAIVRVLGWHF